MRPAMDPGSVDNVLHPKELPDNAVVNPNTTGEHFRGANGSVIENMGERTLHGSMGAQDVRLTAQVYSVTKPLYSVSMAVEAGYDVTFSQSGSGMTHCATGNFYPFSLRNGLYELTLNMESGFARLGTSA